MEETRAEAMLERLRTPVPSPHILVEAARTMRPSLARSAADRDRDGTLPAEQLRGFVSAGLGAARVPSAYGGAGASFRDLATIIIELAAGDSSMAQIVQPHFIFLERVRLMGSEAQRARYLGEAARGALFGNAMSELGGDKAGTWRTCLRPDGTGYRLDGRKFYGTGTLVADYTFVGAMAPGKRHVLVIVPTDRPGLTMEEDWDGFGQRGTGSGSVVFENVAIVTGEVIDLTHWQNHRHHTGAGSQLIHCAIDAGIAAAALDDAVAYARTKARASRESGVERAVDDTTVQDAVGDIAMRSFAAEAAVLHAADALDRAGDAFGDGVPDPGPHVERLLIDATVAVAKAKIVSSRAALRAAERLFDVAGASATRRSHNLDRHWRNARSHTVHDPLALKYRMIGDHLLRDRDPPIGFTY